MSHLAAYLPQDRSQALAQNQPLPEHPTGAALFADISGFTALTETLARELGPRRGIEELSQQINAVYAALITEVEKHQGSVVGFAGDAITCWFADDNGHTALTVALALQTAMLAFPHLGLKATVATGPARRWAVGDPALQLLDTLAGATILRLADAEHLASRGEVLIDEATTTTLGPCVTIAEWRHTEAQERFAVVAALQPLAAPQPFALLTALAADQVRPWILPAIFEREQSGHGTFITELRPAVALFLRFTGLDYDTQASAGEQLNTFICRVQHCLARAEGVLLQLTIGDKGSYLYAAFGAPVAHEDDARRALHTALELRQLATEFSFLQTVQIGLSQGTMRTGAYGSPTRRTYGVLGDDVNLAARLMTLATPGEILVSPTLHKTLQADFVFKAYPPVPLKGKAEPIPVFAVLGPRPRRAIRLEEPQYHLPLVGRTAERATLAAKLMLARQGQGQIIGLTAEAGLGKSRLVAEAIRLATQQGFVGYGGACTAAGANTPYLVWKAIGQAFFTIDPATPLPEQLQRLTALVAAHAPARLPALPVLASVLDLPLAENAFTRTLAPKDRRNVVIAMLEECLQSAANQTPLLLVLEDLHWIDALSLELLENLAKVSTQLPVCFVLAYRPPERAVLQALRLERLPHFTCLTLDQLSTPEATQLIQAKLAQLFPNAVLPPTLPAELATRTQGNPFYIEELLNYLHDHYPDVNSLAQQSALALPTSLQALILSRLDRLHETERVMLKTASVIGRAFRLVWLHGYYPTLGALPQMQAYLSALTQLDLTVLDSPEPDLVYIFKHILTREVVYESLPYATRAQLHEQLAQYIETLGADRHLDLLAFHYSQSDNKPKQCLYLQQAGAAAQAGFANEVALDYFARLLPLLTEPQAQLTLHINRGTILELIGQYPEAAAAYHAALALAEQLADAAAIARCWQALGVLAHRQGDLAAAQNWLKQALAKWEALGEVVQQGQVWMELGSVLYRKGTYPEARHHLEKGLTLARKLGDQPSMGFALHTLGYLAFRQSFYPLAEALFEQSLEIRRELGLKQDIALTLTGLGNVAHEQQAYATAQALFEESLTLQREIGDKHGLGLSLNCLGLVAQVQKDYAQAQQLYEKSLRQFREIESKWGITIALSNLGNLAVAQNQYTQAQAFYAEGLRLGGEMGNKHHLVFALAGLAAVAVGQANLARAATLAAAAETLRVSLGGAWEMIEGQLYQQTLAAARAGLPAATFTAAWATGKHMPLEEIIGYALAAEVL